MYPVIFDRELNYNQKVYLKVPNVAAAMTGSNVKMSSAIVQKGKKVQAVTMYTGPDNKQVPVSQLSAQQRAVFEYAYYQSKFVKPSLQQLSTVTKPSDKLDTLLKRIPMNSSLRNIIKSEADLSCMTYAKYVQLREEL